MDSSYEGPPGWKIRISSTLSRAIMLASAAGGISAGREVKAQQGPPATGATPTPARVARPTTRAAEPDAAAGPSLPPLPPLPGTADAAASPTFFQQDNSKNPGAEAEAGIGAGGGQPGSDPAAPKPNSIGKESDLGFTRRLFNAYFVNDDVADEYASVESRRGPGNVPTPFSIKSPPFPFQDHIGPNIGVNDTSVYPLMEALYNGPNGQAWKDSRIKIYGWADPSYNFSTSRRSNIPLSYAIVPNSLQLSQAILIFERQVDSVQRDHTDWGFKITNLYGIDYRYTTAKGYFSNQLLKHNRLYGYDPLQLYVDYYIPTIGEGSILRVGRYISPMDIEAQLSPENYLYTHSIMYTYDPYTFTGIQLITKLNKNFTFQTAIHGGNDMALWTKSSQVNGEFLLKWVSDSGRDSLFGGVDSIGKGYFSHNHDDLQVLGLTYSHKFNDKFHTLTEAYYLFERQALTGGSTTLGPNYPYQSTGPGTKIPGLAQATGIVNYTAYALSPKAYVVLRNDLLYDPQGFRTGFRDLYSEVTLGLGYHITPWMLFRPEIRYERAYNNASYDNGTKKEQYTTSADIIIRF